MLILFFSEFAHYLNPSNQSSVSVDLIPLVANQVLEINLDLIMPGMKCIEFGLDLIDTTGTLSIDIEDSIFKQDTNNGCNIRGIIPTQKVNGEFHIAFGRHAHGVNHEHIVGQGKVSPHIHHYTPAELTFFNSSHLINHLSFGKLPPPKVMKLGSYHPLDGVNKTVPFVPNSLTHGRFHYLIKIVPSRYIDKSGKISFGFQYTYMENDVIYQVKSAFQQPGVYFMYEISAYMVTYEEKHVHFSFFFTRMCSLVGGVFVIAGLLSRLFFSEWLQNKLKRLKIVPSSSNILLPHD